MIGSALPPALVSAALGLSLSFAAPRERTTAPPLFWLVAAAAAFAPVPTDWVDVVFLGCWATVLLTAASIHLPPKRPAVLAPILAANAGLWAGGVVAVAADRIDMLWAAPWVLLCLPGAWLARTGRGVAVKVAGSWLMAVAVLCAFLMTIPTPGYKPDHMG